MKRKSSDWAMVAVKKEEDDFGYDDSRLERRWKRRCAAYKRSNQKNSSNGQKKAFEEMEIIPIDDESDDNDLLHPEHNSYLSDTCCQIIEEKFDDDYDKLISHCELQSNDNSDVNVVKGCIENDNVGNIIVNDGIETTNDDDATHASLGNCIVHAITDDDGGKDVRSVGDDTVITFAENVNFVERSPNCVVGVEAPLDVYVAAGSPGNRIVTIIGDEVVNDTKTVDVMPVDKCKIDDNSANRFVENGVRGNVFMDIEYVKAEPPDGTDGNTVGSLDDDIVDAVVANDANGDAMCVGNGVGNTVGSLDGDIVDVVVANDGNGDAMCVGNGVIDSLFSENVNNVDRSPNCGVGVEAPLDVYVAAGSPGNGILTIIGDEAVNDIMTVDVIPVDKCKIADNGANMFVENGVHGNVAMDIEYVKAESPDGNDGNAVGSLDDDIIGSVVANDGNGDAMCEGNLVIDSLFSENVNSVDRSPNRVVGVEDPLDVYDAAGSPDNGISTRIGDEAVNDIKTVDVTPVDKCKIDDNGAHMFVENGVHGNVAMDIEYVKAESPDGTDGNKVGSLDDDTVDAVVANDGNGDAMCVGNGFIDSLFSENVDVESANVVGVNLRHDHDNVVGGDEAKDHTNNRNNDFGVVHGSVENVTGFCGAANDRNADVCTVDVTDDDTMFVDDTVFECPDHAISDAGSMDVNDDRYKDNDNVDPDYVWFLKQLRKFGVSFLLENPKTKEMPLLVRYEICDGQHDGSNAENLEATRDFPKTRGKKAEKTSKSPLRRERMETRGNMRDVANRERKVKKKAAQPVSSRVNGRECKRTSPEFLSSSKRKQKCETEEDMLEKGYQVFLNSVKKDGKRSVSTPESNREVIYVESEESSSDSEVLVINGDQFSQGKHASYSKTQTKKEESNKCIESSYREELIKTLQKPYDENEYKSLLQEAIHQKPVEHNIVLRGQTKSYKTKELAKSYLDQHRDLAAAVYSVKYDRPKVLNLLRGFFYWLQNLAHDDSFPPWKDESCLKIFPPL